MMRWTRILLLQEVLLFLFMVAGTHGMIVPLSHPITTDYSSFYAAGHLANEGTPGLAYDRAAHYLAEQSATQHGISYVFFFYPPVFLLVCALFAHLPYIVSFVAFQTMTLGLYLLAMRAVLAARGWGWIIPVLAFPACFVALGNGQNAFLTAALFAGATFLLDRRPILSGILFGLICYKPHFGLLIPLALVAGGCFRAFLAAALTVALATGASVAAYGLATWKAYFAAFLSSQSVYETGGVPFRGFVTPFGAARLLSIPPTAAYAVQIGASLVVAAIVMWVWRRDCSPSIRGASLIAATLLAVPLGLYYDLVMQTVAIAWLARGQRDTALPPWEKLCFVAVYLAPVLIAGTARHLCIPIGPVSAILLLTICLARFRQTQFKDTRTDGAWGKPALRSPHVDPTADRVGSR